MLWERLFLDIVHSRDGDQFVLIVDAVDEGSTKLEADRLLEFLAKLMSSSHNVYLLISSQRHVAPINESFDIHGVRGFRAVDVNSDVTDHDMMGLIDGELSRRKIRTPRSVFCMQCRYPTHS